MNIKKIFLLLSLAAICLVPTTIFAVDLGTNYTQQAAAKAGFDKNTSETTLSETIGTVIKAALSLVGTIFLALTVYAGFLWMTASGDESQIEKAQNIIRSSVIGLVIALSAYGVTTFVVGRVVEKTTNGTDAALQNAIEP